MMDDENGESEPMAPAAAPPPPGGAPEGPPEAATQRPPEVAPPEAGADQSLEVTAPRPSAVPRPETGEPRVDTALSLLDELTERPVTEHPAVFERVQEELSAVLGELDSRPLAGPGPTPMSAAASVRRDGSGAG
jgi:hypothetical protein